MQLRQTAFFLLVITSFLSSCAALKGKYHRDLLHKSLVGSPLFTSHFTGFALYDPADEKYLYEWNSDKYFTPASNTKLLTFFAGLTLLQDSIPGLIYELRNDSLFFTGTGDPTFLHPDFPLQPVFDLLNDTTYSLHYVKSDFRDDKFSSGWSWEDYQYYFQPERTGLPMYGNVIHFDYDSINDSFSVNPAFFKEFVDIRAIDAETTGPNRLQNTNIFSFAPDTARSPYKNCVPFLTSDELTLALLEDTLKRRVHWVENYDFEKPQLAYSRPARDLFALMLKRSDNHFAEQIQYLCAAAMRKPLASTPVREYILDQKITFSPRRPVWTDGSGLSRHNLFTPASLIQLMIALSKVMPVEELKQMLAIGGVDGTLRSWYKPKEGEAPYVFGKTGTLNNNHNLTGIIHTRAGHDLFFSFMNNNYNSNSRPVKQEMEKVMRLIYERY